MVDDDSARPAGGLLRRHRDFRLLWVGSTIGRLGDSITVIALPLVAVSTLNATAFQVGLLSAAAWVAWLIIGLPVGAWVDRWRRRPVLVISSAASFLIFVSVPIAAGLHLLSIGLLLVLALLSGCAAVFFQTSYFPYLTTILTADDRPTGTSMLEGSSAAANIVGQGAGGLIAQLAGAVNGMLADAVTFLVTIACVLGIRQPEQPPVRPDEPTTMVADIRGGMAFILGDQWVRPMVLFGTVANFALTGYDAIQVVFLVRSVGLSSGSVGGLIALTSVGGVVGAFLAGRVSAWLGSARAQLAFIATTVSVLLIPLTFGGPGVLLFIIGGFGVSFGVAGSNVVVAIFAQGYAPQHMLGRLAACSSFLGYGAIPIGALVGGALASALGPRGGMWVMTALVPLSGLFLLLSPVRTVRDLPSPPEPEPTTETTAEPEPQPG
jgi:MFS family permease